MTDVNNAMSLTHTEMRVCEFVFTVHDCPVDKVVVYLDRAEVRRVVTATIKKGQNEIILKNLSSCIDEDSIRVEGKGPATIQEVKYQATFIPRDEEAANSKKKQLENRLKAIKEEREDLENRKERSRTQLEILGKFAESLTKSSGSIAVGTNHATVNRLDKAHLDGINDFFKLYASQSLRLDSETIETKRKLEKLEEQIHVTEKNIAELGAEAANRDVQSRECSIILETSQEEAKIQLFVSYVVTNATWSPSYDIRVFSQENQMKIQYYGMIKQNTGEDWMEAKLFLSTAMPSIGGTVPELGTLKLYFKPRYHKKSLSSSRKYKRSLRYADHELVGGDFDGFGSDISRDEAAHSEMKTMTAKIKESITSTTYEIPRSATIPSDNAGHKVAVAIVDLSPQFEFETVPRKAPHAFLKARVKNTSQCAFLPGPTNIFLDNNFVAKADLKAVSPSEDFVCSLGVDPSVRVTYKPLQKFHEHTGILTKTTTMTYQQDIEIKNTHQYAIKITVTDHLPQSTEEKLKVNLIQPNIKTSDKSDKKPIRLTKQNNVQWDVDIPAGETKDIVLKYSVDHPAAEEVDTSLTTIGTSTTL